MIIQDEDSLICDLAETYHIYDYRGLLPCMVATLSVGLGDNSRIKKKLSGNQLDTNTLLLGIIADKVSWLVWSQTEDGQKNRNHPKSIVDIMTGKTETKNDEIKAFSSAEEFWAEWER